MRPLALAAAFVCLLGSVADAQSRNERIRRSARSGGSSGHADDGRSSSGSSDGDCSGCANVACATLDICSACSSASRGPVVVVHPHQGHGAYHQSAGSTSGGGPALGLDLLIAGQWVPGENVTLAGHGHAIVDLWLGPGFALRGGIEHSSWFERVPTQYQEGATVPEYWDHLPLTTLRGGILFGSWNWSASLFMGLRMLWLPDTAVPGLDFGLSGDVVQGDWFGELGVAGIAFDGFMGVEPWLRLGRAWGPLRLGAGWRHLHLFDGGIVPLTGPEVSLGLRF